MTSRRQYWCTKTMKWRPCWCPKPILWEWNFFLLCKNFLFSNRFAYFCRPREGKPSIRGFYIDSTKIQTKKVSISSEFLLSRDITATQNLYLRKFLVSKGSSFCDRRRLNFQALASRGIKLASAKSLMWVKNFTDFLRFCYLNIPCLRINITLIFTSSSSDESTHK